MELLTRTQVAKFFGVHQRTIQRWLKNGDLKGYKLGKSSTSPWRISKEDVDIFLKKNT